MNQASATPVDRVGLENCGPRRLPVYFLLDFSASAQPGFAAAAALQVQAVINQIRVLADQSREDYNRAPVFYTIIVFRNTALQLQPLAPLWTYPLEDLRLGEIETQGEPGFAAALAALQKSIKHELKMPGADNGDYYPQVFLFTDEMPVEKWKIPFSVKMCVCGIQPAPQNFQVDAGPVPDFLPLDCQKQILEKIKVSRNQLQLRQHMIDYPTNY